MQPHNIVTIKNVAFDVTLTQTGANTFAVSYGMQQSDNLDYAQAAQEFGECLLHAMACDGRIGARPEHGALVLVPGN